MRPSFFRSLTPQCLTLVAVFAVGTLSGCGDPRGLIKPLENWKQSREMAAQNQSRAIQREPVINLVERNIPAEITKDKLADALRLGAVKAGWKPTMVADTEIEATYRAGDRLAVVRITFEDGKYSILYERSEHLLYTSEGQQMIQLAYNGWVTNLDTLIQGELAAMAPKASAR